MVAVPDRNSTPVAEAAVVEHQYVHAGGGESLREGVQPRGAGAAEAVGHDSYNFV